MGAAWSAPVWTRGPSPGRSGDRTPAPAGHESRSCSQEAKARPCRDPLSGCLVFTVTVVGASYAVTGTTRTTLCFTVGVSGLGASGARSPLQRDVFILSGRLGGKTPTRWGENKSSAAFPKVSLLPWLWISQSGVCSSHRGWDEALPWSPVCLRDSSWSPGSWDDALCSVPPDGGVHMCHLMDSSAL